MRSLPLNYKGIFSRGAISYFVTNLSDFVIDGKPTVIL